MSMSYAEVSRLTEDQARAHLESLIWPNGPACRKCGNADQATLTRLKGKTVRPGLIQCKACRAQFTVTVGTIFERSHIPLSKWVQAIYKMCSSKKGISALQLKRELWGENKGSYETAWFMCMRIREAMTEKGFTPFSGTIEADETYVGGKEKNMHRNKAKDSKTAVFALVERSGKGRARTFPVADASAVTLQNVIRKNVHRTAILNTDEWGAYKGVGDGLGGHHAVNHSRGEYVRRERNRVITTNSVESFFSLLKRGVHGTFHHVSRKHLARYANEFSFRWSHRAEPDADRAIKAILGAEGKRLTYA